MAEPPEIRNDEFCRPCQQFRILLSRHDLLDGVAVGAPTGPGSEVVLVIEEHLVVAELDGAIDDVLQKVVANRNLKPAGFAPFQVGRCSIGLRIHDSMIRRPRRQTPAPGRVRPPTGSRGSG